MSGLTQASATGRGRAYPHAWMPCLAFAAGVGVFLLAFGPAWLDPQYVQWLLRGDWSQHYLGWEAFRHDQWRWPPGYHAGVAPPMGTTVVFTDSLPLLAIPLKALGGLLPSPFQYQGLWMALSWGLQGLFAYLLLARISGDHWVSLAGSLLFILLPSLFFRIGHDTLVAQWLILAALYLYTFPFSGRAALAGLGLLALATLVHAYLLLMVLAIGGTWWLANLPRQWQSGGFREKAGALVYPLVAMAWLLAIAYLAGYFVAGGGLAAPGFGTYSLNLNAFINPMEVPWGFIDPALVPDWSRLLPPLPRAHFNQYEGFNYLGLGVLLLVGAGLVLLAWRAWGRLRRRPPAGPAPAPGFPRAGYLVIPLGVLVGWALTNRVTWGDIVLFEYALPWPLSEPSIQSVFRSTGRLVWPLVLVALAGLILYLSRRLPRKRLAVGLALLALVQAVDQYPAWQSVRTAIAKPVALPLKSACWDQWIAHARHVVILPARRHNDALVIDLGARALPRGVTLNSFSLARFDPQRAQRQEQAAVEELKQGGADKTLYVLEASVVESLPHAMASRVRHVDGQAVIPPASAAASPSRPQCSGAQPTE